jgi:N-acetylglucosamine-6-sulfatase
MNIMAGMDQAWKFLSSRRVCAALVLVAACLLAGCDLAMAERQMAERQSGDAGKTVSAERTMGAERAANDQTLERPNIILILTDDLDAASISRMPNLRSLLIERGTTFENAFVTDPLCCPSRATILRGQYAHNHKILGNEAPHGGFEKFSSMGHQNSTMATWLQSEGYQTIFVGKYMNGYEGTEVPPGWDEWYAVSGNYMSTDLNENGKITHYDPGQDYLTDVLANRAANYVRRPGGGALSFFVPHQPFFMWLGTTAPHQPADPAPRHKDALADVALPKPPSFDENDVSDKPAWVRDNPPLSPEQIAVAEDLYRKRLQSMLSVDEMIGQLVDGLRDSGELDDTYLVFTSDNGFHLGTHRLTAGKWTAYEEDIRVPLIVRGPGVPEGRKLEHLVLNNDLAPTFADLAGAATPSFVDGRSLKPLLTDDPPPPDDWRQAFLVEAATELSGTWVPVLSGDQLPEDWRHAPREDWGRPGLEAIRTEEYLYVEYGTSERELYDLREAPYQLDNIYEESADSELLRRLQGRLAALRGCSGTTCRAAEGGH